MKLLLALLALCASTATAFQAPARASTITLRRGGVSMAAEKSVGDRVAAAALAALMATAPVLPLVASPQQAVAARSGGRAGGRGGGGGSSFRSAAPRAAAPTRSTTINNNYGGRPMGGGGVIVAPVISPFGYGYGSPFGGLGTGYALGAMSNNGERQAQYRMENELGSEEAKVQQLQKELEESKAMNAKLEERMDKLEQK
eukprot:CAMPEP_0182534536 /NCGR_PEP_ID=MMETSP1323-20130603/15954_1 /TAXON_ID=236787 /ORGANISM="Florenciella parvula, Strain RCC1693" /LENGTH=199 /DNA_ID=CAMNT_0024744561 /DNA_START=30 /DNA_END=629 /DNA_ORIENTATION=-